MAGHLFVTRGSLARLACDAVLVPSGWGPDGRPWHTRREHWSALADRDEIERSTRGSTPETTRVVEIRPGGWPAPSVWIGHTGEGGQTPQWYADGVGAFVRGAAAGARDAIASAGRRASGDPPKRPLGDPRPFVAVPLVGIGSGGAGRRKDETIKAIVRAIRAVQRDVDVDVAVVARGDANFAATQQARGVVAEEERHDANGLFAELGPGDGELRRQAAKIGRSARRGRLVPFVGAGVGIGAGLPSWSELLGALADEGEFGADERVELERLDVRDQAAVIERRLGRAELERHVARLTRHDVHHVSLLHQLIASMPVRELVTTNYDLCLETAFCDALHPLVRIERRPKSSDAGWLLKLHGSAGESGSIVLSREDYLRFEGEGVALAGVVQAMLLTRHLLFVGYSLSDDNFHRLVHQAGRIGDGRPVGASPESTERANLRDEVNGETHSAPGAPGSLRATALTPQPYGLAQSIWDDRVHFVSTARAPTANPVGDESEHRDDPRRLAILLDLAASHAYPATANLLDASYESLFVDSEREVGRRLAELWNAVDKAPHDSAVTAALRDALATLGDRRTALSGE